MVARVAQPAGIFGGVAGVEVGRHGRAREDEQRVQQGHDNGNFHLPRLNLLAQQFRGSAYHQPRDEHGDDDEHEKVEEAHAHAAVEGVGHHAQQLGHARDGHVRVVHGVYRAAGNNGVGYAPIGRGRRAEAYFLAFHRAQTLVGPHVGDGRVAVHLIIYRGGQQHQEAHRHHPKHHVGELRPLQIIAEGKHHGQRNEHQGEVLNGIGNVRGVFERVSRIGSEKAAPVGTQLLDGNHGGGGATAHVHRIPLHRHDGRLAGPVHGRALEHQYQRHGQRNRQQHAGDALHEVIVEIAQLLGSPLFQGVENHHAGGHTGGGRHELQEGDGEQLRKVRGTRLARIVLQVAVHQK